MPDRTLMRKLVEYWLTSEQVNMPASCFGTNDVSNMIYYNMTPCAHQKHPFICLGGVHSADICVCKFPSKTIWEGCRRGFCELVTMTMMVVTVAVVHGAWLWHNGCIATYTIRKGSEIRKVRHNFSGQNRQRYRYIWQVLMKGTCLHRSPYPDLLKPVLSRNSDLWVMWPMGFPQVTQTCAQPYCEWRSFCSHVWIGTQQQGRYHWPWGR
jgi:hypothetical protein